MLAQMLGRALMVLAGATAVGRVPGAITGPHQARMAIGLEEHAPREHQGGGTLDAAVEGVGEAGVCQLTTRRTAVGHAVVSKSTVAVFLLL